MTTTVERNHIAPFQIEDLLPILTNENVQFDIGDLLFYPMTFSLHYTRLASMVQLFLVVVVCTCGVMLFLQMHVVNNHLSNFHFDPYQEQQMFLREYLQHQPQYKDHHVKGEDGNMDPILRILKQAGYNITNEEEIERNSLPKWSKIMDAYGEPKILGLETCQKFQETVDPSLRNLGVAGLFNTGTNLLYEVLNANCKPPKESRSFKSTVLWQVPWGKHVPADHRETHRIKSRNDYIPTYQHTLPVVTVRDPYTWMQSMCRQNYAAQFDHSKEKCPNIVPYPSDVEAHPRYGNMKYIPVHTKYDEGFKRKYESLPMMWNEWYSFYLNASFPFLLIRMEDLVFNAETLMPQICECAGFEYNGRFQQISETANKNHGIEQNHTSKGLLRSIIRYGNITNRREGYPQFQLDAAEQTLGENLMHIFGYIYED